MTAPRADGDRPIVFCLAHAGGSAERAFRGWERDLADCADVTALELAGRGRRAAEPPFASMREAAAECAARIRADARPAGFLLFGHSMGGLLAYEVDALLHARGWRRPSAVAIAGTPPPNRRRAGPGLHALPDAALLHEVERLAGVAPELLSHRSTREFVVAALRADYRIYERYALAEPPHRIAPPLLLLLGGEDPLTRPDDPALWAQLACGAVALRTVPGGGHFFPVTHRQATLTVLRALVRTVTGGAGARRHGA